MIRSLLDLFGLVKGYQTLEDCLVLEELEDPVRAYHHDTILLSQVKLYLSTLLHFISGIGLTPTEAPTRSPKLRVIANPGTLSPCTHTRRGPIGSPNSSLKASILPLIFFILYASFSRLGLWSVESGTASQLPDLQRPKMARLSPTFAQIRRLWLK